MKIKKCRGCNLEFSLDNFYKDKSAKDGTRNICKQCTIERNGVRQSKLSSSKIKSYRDKFKDKHGVKYLRAYSKKSRIKVKYGLTVEEYLEHLETPCEICGDESEHLDHCHATGKVRGGLCRPCNWMLGNARDDTAILSKAINYLNTER